MLELRLNSCRRKQTKVKSRVCAGLRLPAKKMLHICYQNIYSAQAADRNQRRKAKAQALKKARSRPLYCCTSTCRLLNAEGRTDDISRIIMWNSQLESEIGYQHEGFKLSTDDLMVSEINFL